MTLGIRGFSRVRRKPREKLFARVAIKTWQKPETALEFTQNIKSHVAKRRRQQISRSNWRKKKTLCTCSRYCCNMKLPSHVCVCVACVSVPLAFLIFSPPLWNFHVVLPTKFVSFVFYLSLYLFVAISLLDCLLACLLLSPFGVRVRVLVLSLCLFVFLFLCIPNLWHDN